VALDPNSYLRVLLDTFTPVRDTQAHLVGCIPKVPDNSDIITDSQGRIYELRWSMQVCVCIDLEQQSPTSLDGFIPLDDTDTDLAVPVARGDDPDLAEGV